MKRILILLLLGMGLFSACGKQSTVYISGDSQAVKAKVYVDDQLVTLMEEHVYEGVKSSDPVIMRREKEFQKLHGIKPSDVGAGTAIRIPSGWHRFTIVNKDGKRLEKKIEVRSENYLIISFEKMTITD